MKIQNLFTSGKMNKDLDERLVPQGEYRDALNVKVANSTGSDVGAIENALSNEAKSSLELGSNAVCIGSVSDDEDRVVYWFVKSDSGCFICYYDQKTDTSNILMSDTRLLTNENPEKSVLNFSEAHMIQANILTDADNLKKFIYFTDGLNPPRRINVATAKTYGVNGFDHEDINVIVKPPLHPPSIRMSDSGEAENNIEDKFLLFAYRYVYEDGEKSALSPFSKNAFIPGSFSFDFIGAINRSMQNALNSVEVTYNTGSKLVKSIDIVFKESGNNNIYLASSINKEEKGYANNSDFTYTFRNNNIYKVLPEDEIFRLYDNVPLKAESQDIISNRLVYGNYEENYDLVDQDDKDINLSLSASYSSEFLEQDKPSETARSNMDYEIGITYLDEYGRSTTVLTSENNSTYVKPLNSISKNTLTATISSKAPSFAKYYRFFVKQSKNNDYNIMSPVTIYNQGDYTWIRLEGDDKNKVEVNDYVIIKSDTDGVKANVIKSKVLDAGVKEKNFLEDSGYTGPILQESGYYIKLAVVGADLTDVNYTKFIHEDKDNSKNATYSNNFTGEGTVYYEQPHYKSITNDIDGATVSGTYTGSADRRFKIEISSEGAVDKFRWKWWSVDQDESTFSSTEYDLSTTPISLRDGLSISFSTTTGFSVGDNWTFNAKADLEPQWDLSIENERHAYIVIDGLPTTPAGNEEITSGTKINLSYSEYKGKNSRTKGLEVNETFTSVDTYENLEEWFWGEGREQFIEAGFDVKANFKFRRGQYSDYIESNNTFAITGSTSDPLCMIIQSELYQLGVSRAYANAYWSVYKRDREDYVVLETIASKNNSDVFYEVPGTYEIDDCGYHKGISSADTDQGFNTSAVINLNFANAFMFGNTGFECYKIRDAFISNALTINNRPLTYIENYRKNHRNASITYSDVYEQSTNYNGLNEFNLSRVNYMDLDDEYGDIKRIHSRDTNLVVFQENKVSYLPYQKSILYNADGSGNVAQTLNVFGTQVPYSGEYGISNSAHSFTSWANRMYFADERRGAIMRLSQDGLTEVSQYGMRDWFRDNVDAKNENVILGGYDPFNGQYVLSIKNPVVEWREDAFECVPASCDLKGVIFLSPPTTTTTSTTSTSTTSTTSTSTTSTTSSTTTTTTTAQQTCYAHQLQYDATTSCQGNMSVYYTDSNVWCQSTKLFMSSSACASDDSNGYAPAGYYTYEVAPASYEYSYWDGSSFSQMCTPC